MHGLGAHSGWVAPLAEALAEHGVFVTAGDLPGHGKRRLPGRAPGREQPETHIPSPGRLLGAVAEMLRASTRLRADPAGGTWIMGTSLGGCLAALFATNAVTSESAADPTTEVLGPGTGTDSTVDPVAPVMGRAVAMESAGVPGTDPPVRGVILLAPAFRPCYLPIAEMIDMAFHLGNRRKTYATPVARGIRICADEDQQRALAADPLGTPGFDARSHLWAQVLIAKAELQLRRVRVPVLCFQGDQDRVVDAEHNEKLIRAHRHGHFEWVRGGFHDLQAEPEIDGFGTRLTTTLRDR